MGAQTYRGFSPRARGIIVGLGALVAILNLAAAWYFAFLSERAMQVQEPEVRVLERLTADITDPTAKAMTRAHMYSIYAQSKTIQNKQSIVLVCFGGGFALVAVGFALFLLGADGAFSLEAQQESRAKLVFSGTAPGLLCFLLAAGLIVVGVTRQNELEIGPLTLDAPSQACANEVNGKCLGDDILGGLK